MKNKLKSFLKINRGSELTQVILGMIISVTLLIIATVYITSTISKYANNTSSYSEETIDNNSNVSKTNDNNNAAEYILIKERVQ